MIVGIQGKKKKKQKKFCDSVKPLYISFLSFFTQQTQCVVVSPPLHYVTVQLLWQVMLHQRLPLPPKTNKHTHTQKTKKQKLQAQKQESKMSQHCPQFLCATYVGDFRLFDWVCSARAPFQVLNPKNERNKTRLTLAPNRGILGVFWTYSGSVVVLSWDLTHKNTQTSTQIHACRVTLTLARSGDTDTRFAPTVRV